MEQLASLVENHDFKNAVKFIRETPEFQKHRIQNSPTG